jgi:hypothetical protein
MRTITTNTDVYKYAELTDDAKQTALERLFNINVEHEWWYGEYEDAANVLLKLTSFGLDRDRHCEGDFMQGAEDTANKVIAEHGEMCETYKTAQNYLVDRSALVEKHSDGIETDIVAEDNEYEFDVECDELDKDFLQSILEDYSIILQSQCEYLQSKEAIVETIEANDYDFTIDGKLF